MSVGIGIKGDEVTISVGGGAILGTTSKGTTFNNEPLSTTDDASSGWQEFSAVVGTKSMELSLSGQVKNMSVVGMYFNSSQIFAVTETYPDGSSLAYDAVLNSVGITGESNGLYTFEMSLASSGQPTWTAGT